MEKKDVTIIFNIAVILLLSVASAIMFNLTQTIKTNGGQCTASPYGYMEQQLLEQTGKEHTCYCEVKETDWKIQETDVWD